MLEMRMQKRIGDYRYYITDCGNVMSLRNLMISVRTWLLCFLYVYHLTYISIHHIMTDFVFFLSVNNPSTAAPAQRRPAVQPFPPHFPRRSLQAAAGSDTRSGKPHSRLPFPRVQPLHFSTLFSPCLREEETFAPGSHVNGAKLR